MEKAILLNGVAQQIVSGIAAVINSKNKFISLKKLYPELFGKSANGSGLTAVEVWDKFLRG